MNNQKYIEWESERFASTFEEALSRIPLDVDDIHTVVVNITIHRKGYTPYEGTYTRTVESDIVKLSYSEILRPVPADPSAEPAGNEPTVPHPPHTAATPEVSDVDLQAFDAVISDPETNRNFIASLKKARNAKEVAEAVLRLVKKGAIGEDRASRKCFAERILPFCTFQKGTSEPNISNTIRNLLTEKHHEIKQSLQQANGQANMQANGQAKPGTTYKNEHTNR